MSQQNYGQQQQQKPDTPLTDRTFKLRAFTSEGKTTQLKISIENNCVKFNGQTPAGWVSTYFPLGEWGMIETLVNRAVISKDAFTADIVVERGKSGQKSVEAVVTVGRDDDGIVYIVLAGPNGGGQRYDFLPNGNYVFAINGQHVPRSELSRMRATGWVRWTGMMIAEEYRTNYTPYDPNKKFNKGGGQWGGKPQYNQAPQQQYQQPPQQQYAPQQQYQPAPQPQYQQAPQPQYAAPQPPQQQYQQPIAPAPDVNEYIIV